jgi:hypothetical protein
MPDPRHWTPYQIEQLRALYPDLKAETVAREIGRSIGSVHRKAVLLGIGKSEAFKASFASGRINAARNDPRLTATRFKPGLVPWNKGVKGATGLHENCRATQFKAGQKPHTAVPVGSYRINVTKGIPRLEQKTNDKPGPNHVRWIPVSRLVWEQHHGPIKPRHIVVFAESKFATTVLEEITVDKLICISRAENALRNHPKNKSPELARLYQLKGAINRQVNRINKEQANEHTTHQRVA